MINCLESHSAFAEQRRKHLLGYHINAKNNPIYRAQT
jgi:hypothetical protein